MGRVAGATPSQPAHRPWGLDLIPEPGCGSLSPLRPHLPFREGTHSLAPAVRKLAVASAVFSNLLLEILKTSMDS